MHKFVLLLLFLHEIYGRTQWTPDQAFAWFNAQKPYIMGTEYMTSSAVNQLEMWQEATFDPVLIDKEMAVGQQLGMTTMRIFLEDLAYSQDPAGFKNRMSTVVEIMSKYGMKPLFVFFANGPVQNPVIGIQPKPRPGAEDSGYSRTPSANLFGDQTKWPALKTYVTDVVGTFANDSRVLAWDMWNEPDDGPEINTLMSLFPQVFDWARSTNPIQPLTSGLYRDVIGQQNKNYTAFEMLQINNSDIITFHEYNTPEVLETAILRLQKLGRPLIATEYMARTMDSFFANNLPVGKKYNIGMIAWGFVNGKTQYNLDWRSFKYPDIVSPPTVWFQDILRQDRSPYLLEEAQIMKRLNGCPLGYHSNVNNWTCYNAYDTPLSFSDAQTACKNTWSSLVTINNAFENSDITTYVSSKFSTCDKFYIGLYNKNSAQWVWPMTTPYNNPAYRNWKSGYPLSDASSNCVVLNKDGTWTNQPCTTPQCYICSY